MFTSDTNPNPRQAAKTAFTYLLISVFSALFGAVYEVYSHEVYSFYMLYAFAFPLVLGAVPFSILNLYSVKQFPCAWVRKLYHAGIATLTIGSIMNGVLEIYGTTNELAGHYWTAGILMLMISFLLYIVQLMFPKQQR